MNKQVNLLSDDIKMEVVQEYLRGGISQHKLMLKYNFRGKQCINNWMRKFGAETSKITSPMARPLKQNTKELSLELKIKLLEEKLRHEQLRTTALSTMIDIAERELNIDIRKKSGAKQ